MLALRTWFSRPQDVGTDIKKALLTLVLDLHETSQLSIGVVKNSAMVRPRVVYTNKQTQLRLIYINVYRVRCE